MKPPAPKAGPRPTAFPRATPTPRAKKEELTTYRELALGRELKSARQRRRLDNAGRMRVIGDGSSEQPRLAVPAARYREVRLEQQRRILIEARARELDLPADRLLAQLTPRIERLTYAQLAEEARQESAGRSPLPALGRALTKEERARFAASSALAGPSAIPSPTAAALAEALDHIERRQTHNPARYQAIWAQLVGSDAAAQSQLHRIDPATRTVYFRCHNSVLSVDLQRRRGLAAQLTKALGTPVRQLRASF
jgi:hypothetical protein